MIVYITLPLTEPILVFTVIILLVLLSPIVLRKVNMPDIIGLIIAGVIVGPHGLNILTGDIALSIFGTIGLLYLMFLAGLEIDLNEFFRQRKNGTLFGLLTFIIPFVFGFIVFKYILNYSIESSLLVATMLSSHTLVSYPILGRIGIVNQRVVTVTISGTIIADTAALICLGFISGMAEGDLGVLYWLKTIGFFLLFFFYVLYLLPKAAKWFFKNMASEKGVQYIFVLSAIFVSATIAELLGIEPLIGAFFTGLSLNRLIPRTTSLMNRIVFIGNTLFIPFFLISIGMLVNLKILVSDISSWETVSILLFLAFFSKYLASFILQKVAKFSKSERNLTFGLSLARAASAIAIMVVGQEYFLVDEMLLNSTIVLILVSCTLSSVLTQKAAQKLVSEEEQQDSGLKGVQEKIMVSVSNPASIEKLIDLSLLIKNPKSHEPIYPLTVVPDNNSAVEQNEQNRVIIRKALEHAAASDSNSELITRIDVNVVDGIDRAARELSITKLIVGWNAKTTTIKKLFGTLLDQLVDKTHKMIMVAKLESEPGLTGNIHVFLPPRCEMEKGFKEVIDTLHNISKHLSRKVSIYGSKSTVNIATEIGKQLKFKPNIEVCDLNDNFFKQLNNRNIPPNDLLIFVKARKNTLSESKITQRIPKIIKKYFCYHNLILLYPNQRVYKSGLYRLYNLN